MMRPLTTAEHEVLVRMVAKFDHPRRAEPLGLLRQVPFTLVDEEASQARLLQLVVPHDVPPAQFTERVLPPRANRFGADGTLLGTFLVIVAGGRLDGLEFAAVSDVAPLAFPEWGDARFE